MRQFQFISPENIKRQKLFLLYRAFKHLIKPKLCQMSVRIMKIQKGEFLGEMGTENPTKYYGRGFLGFG